MSTALKNPVDPTGSPTPESETPRPVGPADGVWSNRALDWITWRLYWGVHVAALGVFFTGVTPTAIALFLGTFWLRMFAITGGYHRYFSHKTYKTGRGFQFVLALLGTMATQKGPLWWAGLHRIHHREADGPGDVHSPKRGFYYSHQGWIFDKKWQATRLEMIPDYAKYPEIQWLNRWHFVPPVGLAVLCYWIGGMPGLFWGYFLSTTVLWHSTYTINSLSHVYGTRRFATDDTSKNNWMLALLTFGEGWHNNHHQYMASCRQGFRWWEIDITYYALRGLAKAGLVWDLREPPEWMKTTNLSEPPQATREAA